MNWPKTENPAGQPQIITNGDAYKNGQIFCCNCVEHIKRANELVLAIELYLDNNANKNILTDALKKYRDGGDDRIQKSKK